MAPLRRGNPPRSIPRLPRVTPARAAARTTERRRTAELTATRDTQVDPRPLVLVVDDSPDGRDMLFEYLTFRGFDACVASDGAQAIDLARTKRPRVILMDLTMPGMDGLDATGLLKADPATKDTLILAVTARAMRSDEEIARAAGCDGFVRKPYDLTLLADGLWRLVEQGAGALDPSRVVPTSRVRARSRKPSDRRGNGG
jgi:two-component system cell cycle response regulator DivK